MPSQRVFGLSLWIAGACPALADAAADLALTKVADRDVVVIGEQIGFTLTLTNLGPSVATDIVFGDPLPDALNFVSISCDRGTPNGSFCSIGSLAPGESATAYVLLTTPISNLAPSERICTNIAYIAQSTSQDENASNDQGSATIYIAGASSAAGAPAVAPLALTVIRAASGLRFAFSLTQAETNADLSLFDVRGRRVVALARGAFPAGSHAVEWNSESARSISRGVYFARLHTESGTVARKLTLSR